MFDQKEYNRKMIEQFRASRGGPDGPLEGRPVLLLTTIGNKSGQPRTTPLMYVRDGDRLIIFASNAGAPTDPDWYRNLVANPEVTVEAGNDTYPATAATLQGADRERIWATVVGQYPFFTKHQAKIERQIPVVALSRKAS